METRQITEYKCYVLNLSEMHGGTDKSVAVAIFDDIEKLKSYYNSQLAPESYTDEPSPDNYGNTHSWHKVFKKGSPLEWYNELNPINTSGGKFAVVSYHAVAFGGVTEYWTKDFPSQDVFNIPFNPS